MKVAFLGGVKSGKSRLAEERVQIMAGTQKPYYLATTECWDEEMQRRIAEHQKRRRDQFETLEESLDLLGAVKRCDRPVLIECVSMWLNNMLFNQKDSADILHCRITTQPRQTPTSQDEGRSQSAALPHNHSTQLYGAPCGQKITIGCIAA